MLFQQARGYARQFPPLLRTASSDALLMLTFICVAGRLALKRHVSRPITSTQFRIQIRSSPKLQCGGAV